VYLVYSLLLTIGFIALMPKLLIGALRHGKYITGLRERLGNVPVIASNDHPIVWLHCVSVGETEAARPLIHALSERFPSSRLVISTTTLTGQAFARKSFNDQATAIFYFPLDWAWVVRRALKALRPSAVLIMETELWPRLLHECHRRKIPVALVNGRISEKSFHGYRMLGPFVRRVVNDLTLALMQTETDAERLSQLGFPAERIHVLGNLKFDSADSRVNEKLTNELRDRYGFDGRLALIAAASTHEPEDRIVIDAFKNLRRSHAARLLIAPRHPERFEAVASLLQDSGLSWARRSEPANERNRNCDVLLLDSIGELRAVYPLSDIVFVGGSIVPKGGQNMIEPAASGACVIAGAYTTNFAAIAKAFREHDAIIQLPAVSVDEATAALTSAFDELMSNNKRREEIAARAIAVCERNRGATERTLKLLNGLLTTATPQRASIHFAVGPAVASK
jgi:3-deoxy-D-manno-octulosonic-acid transferase